MQVRNGKPLQFGGDKFCRVIESDRVSDKLLLGADQIIVGKNATRHKINEQVRQLKWGEQYTEQPLNGEKVICLKNYWGILSSQGEPAINGMIGQLNNINYRESILLKDFFEKEMVADFSIGDKNTFSELFMDYKLFTDGQQTINSENWKKYRTIPKPYLFDYAYCITCHKSQGSEFNKVLVFDEYLRGTNHAMWLYTAATRAKKKLIIVSDV
jgi:exodeoxyribonuclease-5